MTPDRRGSLFLLAAMAGFAVEDKFLNAAARRLPIGEVILLMGLAGLLVFGLAARAGGAAALPRACCHAAGCCGTGYSAAPPAQPPAQLQIRSKQCRSLGMAKPEKRQNSGMNWAHGQIGRHGVPS